MTTTPSTNYVYPQDKVKITATYRSGRIGDVEPAFQPETVEITLNDDAVPTDPAECLAFLTGLVETLFTYAPADGDADVVVDPDMGLQGGNGDLHAAVVKAGGVAGVTR
jgi:hypothetical protein